MSQSQEQEQIIIQSITEPELLACYGHLCLQVQREYDISPSLLSLLLNDSEMIEYCRFLYEQCHIELIDLINQFKGEFFEAINTASPQGSVEVNDHEYEKCGFVRKVHRNGYVEYCNYHKYLHVHPDMGLIAPSTTLEANSAINHQFVSKEANQIIKETYQGAIYIHYQNHINKLYGLIRRLFDDLLKRTCEVKSQSVDLDQFDLNPDPKVFRSKGLYEYLNLKEDQSTQPSYYYQKVYTYRGTL